MSLTRPENRSGNGCERSDRNGMATAKATSAARPRRQRALAHRCFGALLALEESDERVTCAEDVRAHQTARFVAVAFSRSRSNRSMFLAGTRLAVRQRKL